MSAWPEASRDPGIPRPQSRGLAVGVLAGVARNHFIDPGRLRSRLLANLWIELKCRGAARVRNVELSRIRGIDRVRVDGPVARHSPLVVTALSMLLQSETLFEIGPDTADTAWLLAHNLPKARILWLDDTPASSKPAGLRRVDRIHVLPAGENATWTDRSPEATRVTRLSGDSGTFDFVPYSGSADVVYIEGSHRYPHLDADTDAAFGLLSELGTIIWDGYPGDAGVYSYLNRLAPTLDRPLFHILGTRLALYSRWDVVIPDFV